ncbi:mechanosensitive ion channel domain-containing protein [Pontibacter sp. G13]|uniref:mechanosensitive ion channel domain-containing protein n=1 Tax=Pontibacter sp. G13 TaxID=3074898 RepID=UPI00288A517C|nr:mechanosensitive ion channel domain-containing protein [Pontibacter sp. G13]WNJ20934.1 hypothetical protein RJD25_10690 [Pontibacter sp. G13]
MKRFLLLSAALFSAAFGFAKGDILTLTNGKTFTGTVKQVQACSIDFKAEDGNVFEIPADDIYTLQFANPNSRKLKRYMEMPASDRCMSGTQDAENFHAKKAKHFVLGFLFGPVAIVGTALGNPRPYKDKDTMMYSQNEDLFEDPTYLQCYKRKAKGQNILYATIGFGTALILGALAASGS